MKNMRCVLGAALLLAATLSLAAEPLPGQVDFGTFTPPNNGKEYVEVNVPASLITLAAKFVEKQEPDIAKLLNGIKLIRVHVVGLDEKNTGDLEQRVQKVRSDLSGAGWERLVTAQKESQDVAVYLKMSEASVVQGLALTVIESKKHAVFVNVVGDVRPEQLATVGERLNIDPLKDLPKVSKEQKKEEQ
jgi:hypothetical protein